MRLLLLAPLLLLALLPTAQAQGPEPVEVSVYVINFGNHDVNKGTYTLDFYLVFRWDAAANVTPGRFEFMNGRATSQELLVDEVEEGRREVWYRIQAELYAEPRFRNYPYDQQVVEVLIEDAVQPVSELVYVADTQRSGVDGTVRVSGWRIDDWSLSADEHAYPFEETYSRAVFRMTLSREPLSITLRTFLPPLTFATLAALAFALHPSNAGNRISLATGMLVSSVGFHISQTVNLPSLGRLSLFDQAMIATYAFIAGSLAVSVLLAYNKDHRGTEADAARINRRGAVVAVVGAVAAFLVLRFV